MRNFKRIPLLVVLCVLAASRGSASGPVGVYGIVEKVVLEPDASAPERIQVWGAFAYAEVGSPGGSLADSTARRGYLYFKLPPLTPGFNESALDAVKKEWADLKAVSGTGQAIGFGRWGSRGRSILERESGTLMEMRVRPASEPPTAPMTYETNAGIVKLSERGSHAGIVEVLRDTLRQ